MGGAERDVFISYGHADADWVRTLAENLYQSGLEVFFDEWDVGPGDVVVHRLDAGIRQPQRHPRRLARLTVAALGARGVRRDARPHSGGTTAADPGAAAGR